MTRLPLRRPALWAFMAGLAVFCSSLLTTPVATTTAVAPAQEKVTTVYLVRHAEKDTMPPDNPPLTEAGRARAQELARVLGQTRLKTVISSQYSRTQQTAEPAAKRFGLPVTTLQIRMDMARPRELSPASIKEIVDKIHAQDGGDVLVVGHSNTVPEVIKMLGVEPAPVIDEKEFDDLFVVTLHGKGKPALARQTRQTRQTAIRIVAPPPGRLWRLCAQAGNWRRGRRRRGRARRP